MTTPRPLPVPARYLAVMAGALAGGAAGIVVGAVLLALLQTDASIASGLNDVVYLALTAYGAYRALRWLQEPAARFGALVGVGALVVMWGAAQLLRPTVGNNGRTAAELIAALTLVGAGLVGVAGLRAARWKRARDRRMAADVAGTSPSQRP